MSRDRTFDPGAVVVGLWFALVGLLAVAASGDFVTDAIPVLVPGTLVVVGLGLLLQPRQWPSAGEDGAGDEVGAESGEDGQI